MRLSRLGGDDDVGPITGGFQSDGFPDAPAGSCDEERAAGELPERQRISEMITTNKSSTSSKLLLFLVTVMAFLGLSKISIP